MRVIDSIRSRFSVRKYLAKEVSEEDITAVLEAARFSQSAKNLQDWRFIVVKDKNMRNRLADAAKGQRFVAEAPVVIACCGIRMNLSDWFRGRLTQFRHISELRVGVFQDSCPGG